MQSNNKNNKINLKDLVRYRKGEMTGRERNVYEKELQKDAFASEAEEGLNNISPEDISKDIGRLQNSVMKRTRRRRRNMIYRIAASIAVLMVISSVFIIIERNPKGSKIAQSTANEVIMEIQQGEVLTGKEADETPAMEQSEVRNNVPPEPPVVSQPEPEISPEKSKKGESVGDIAIKSDVTVSEPLAAMAEKRAFSRSVPAPTGKAEGKVISSEDNLPVPGASVRIKGTNNAVITDESGNFSIDLPENNVILVADYIGMVTKEIPAKADSRQNIVLNPDVMSLSEVVVVGYGVQKAEPDSEGNVSYTPPQPVNGKTAFNNYVKENILRPDSADQRVVVVIGFIVQTDGTIDSINVIRSPDKKYSDEAIRLLKEGPAWKPAEKNGVTIRDKSEVKIVFR